MNLIRNQRQTRLRWVRTQVLFTQSSPSSSAGSVEDLRIEGRWFDTGAQPIYFPRNDESHSFHTAVQCFRDGHVEEQPRAWREYCEC